MGLVYFDIEEPKIKIGFVTNGQFVAYSLPGSTKALGFYDAFAAHARLDNLCEEFEKDLRDEGWYVADGDFNPIARRPVEVERRGVA